MVNPKRHDPWYRKAVLYQIYPLSWADSNGDGYGDLRGIIERLDYLNDGTAGSLGVGAIWLSPIYRSGLADWGYDIIDHCAIDPLFGTMADFDVLLREVHKRGMRLLLDYVPNHTSSKHSWFVEARKSRGNPKRDWYIWADPKPDGSMPNNWLSRFGGPMWTLDDATGQYYLHTFLADQPDLNWRNPEVRAAMLEVLRFWLRRGVDGFRTDAVTALIKDQALRNDPPNPDFDPATSLPSLANLRIYSNVQGGLGGLVGSFCDVLAEKEDTFLLSEAYLNISGLKELYGACERHPIHAPFNFNLITLDWSAEVYRQFIDEYEGSLGPNDWPNYVLGNHDKQRIATRRGQKRARLLAFLQMTLRGLPVVYAGEELGLENGVISTTNERDISLRKLQGPLLKRDVSRTPMPWSGGYNGGFSEGSPWLPLSPDYAMHNVELEERQPESMLALYRHLIHLRAACEPLADGAYRSIAGGNPDVFVFIREAPWGKCYVMLNFANTEQRISLREIGIWIAGTHLIEGDGQPHDQGEIRLKAYEGRLYELMRTLK